MSDHINFYKNRVCINVLSASVENALACYNAAEKHVLIGVLSTEFKDIESAKKILPKYQNAIDNAVSLGLGSGNPKQSDVVAEIARDVKTQHYNQVFTGVGKNRALSHEAAWINGLVSPTGSPGLVYIGTGQSSSKLETQTPVSVETAILLLKDMGANALKFFPMNGLATLEEYKAVCKACAKHEFGLEPTGGITLDNFQEILEIALDAGVPKIIPHVYSSIIDAQTGMTRVEDVKVLWNIVKEIV